MASVTTPQHRTTFPPPPSAYPGSYFQSLQNMSSHHHHRRNPSPSSKRYSVPARSSTNSISSSAYDPYYEIHRRGSKDDYVIKTTKASAPPKVDTGVIPISTETYVSYPGSSMRSPVVDSFSSRPRRSTLTGSDRPQTGLRNAASSIPHEKSIARPSSPLSKAREVESYSKPLASTTRSSHKKVYSIDDRSGEARLISESGSGPQYVFEDEARRERPKHRSHKKEIDESEFSYTDPAGMFRDTEPSWRPRDRERRGSIDSGTSARPTSYIDTANLYGPPPRSSTTRLDGPPPSTRGFDQINSGLARNRSLREPARASSRDRYRSDTYDTYGSDDDYDRRYAGRRERAAPVAYRDYDPREYEPARQRSSRDAYPDDHYASESRRDPRDDQQARRFRDQEVENRGFGIRHRSPSKDRYGVSSNESLEDRRMSSIPIIPAGYTASSQDLSSTADTRQYLGSTDPRNDRRYSRDDRYYSSEPPRGPERHASRDDRSYDLPPPPRREERRTSPDTRQHQEPSRRDEDKRLDRDYRDSLPPPPPISDRRPSPQRRDPDDEDYSARRERDRSHRDRDERPDERRKDDDDDHHHRGAAAAVAGAAALGAGALGVEEHRRRERKREEGDKRAPGPLEEPRRRDIERSSRDDMRDDDRPSRDQKPENTREPKREERREEPREPKRDELREDRRDDRRDDRDERRSERNIPAPREPSPEKPAEPPKEAPRQLDPDEEYRRRIAEAQRELYGDSPRGSSSTVDRSDRERRRLRHDDRKIGRDAAVAGAVGAAGAEAYEHSRGQDDPLKDRRDRPDDRDRSRQSSSYDPRYLPPPPPGGPPGPRSSNGSLHSAHSITDREMTAEPAEMRQDENRGMPGGYPRDSRPPYPGSDGPPPQTSGDIAITDAMALVPAGKVYHGQGSSDEYSSDGRERKETRVRIVEPARHDSQSPPQAPKSILRKPTEKFPEDPNPIREGVAPLKDARVAKVMKERGIPAGAKWTKIDRKLVNPQALVDAKERFEERLDCVIVLRVLTKEEIQALADRTREIREERESKYEREHGRHHEHRRRRRKHRDDKDGGDKDDESETDDTDLDDNDDRDKRRDDRKDERRDRERDRRDDEPRKDKDRDGERERDRGARDKDAESGKDRQR